MLEADASPTKNFFVEILTRDIALPDAVLDLLDNCVDGVQRSLSVQKLKEESPYEGYFANISFDKDHFSILDNCGGIPLEVAKNYALRMGRPSNVSLIEQSEKDLFIIGTYGIGMKRALFKMGSNSTISSKNKENKFYVQIDQTWLNDDKWKLPIIQEEINPNDIDGTKIIVSNLFGSISKEFSKKSFESDLVGQISENYSFIMSKGFKITVNGIPVKPKPFALIWNENAKGEHLAPYVYSGKLDGVDVSLVIGFYRDLPTEQEEIDDTDGVRWASADAGWTVICNDRVVIHCDKTRLTGWGEARVPQYHTQFIAIAGLVVFKSHDPRKLPITTTKRGIDASSERYLHVKEFMREGLKLFTQFTNDMKKNNVTNKVIASNVQLVKIEPEKVVKKLEESKDFKAISKSKQFTKSNQSLEKRYMPNLPKYSISKTNENDSESIKFSRPSKDIKLIAEVLLENDSASASEVGSYCFDYVLGKVK